MLADVAKGSKPEKLRLSTTLPLYPHNQTSTRLDGTLAKAFVRFDFNTSPQPKLAVLLKGQGRLGEWRDLYIIDTALGTFTHVNEIYADGPNKEPSMAVQGGTCTAAASVR